MARTTASGRRRRTFGDFVRAFAAFVALAVLLAGVPLALAFLIPWTLPHELPSIDTLPDTLQAPITTDTFITVLGMAVWLAWAQFTACVLVEVKAAASGIGMPARVPGAGPSQLLARQLIAALLLVGAGAASLTPGLSQLGGFQEQQAQRGGVVATAAMTPGQQAAYEQHQQQVQQRLQAVQAVQAESTRTAAAEDADSGATDTKFYRIQPPEGRHHDSLWEIAERHLGDGRRYKEIYQLNKDRAQPDGSRLSQASLIRPGWIMEMPADARGGELVEMPDEAAEVTHEVREQIDRYQQTGGAEDTTAEAGTAASVSAEAGTGGAATAPTDGRQEQEAPAAGQTQADELGLPEALIASPLLAAGLLAALGRRRRTALWQSVAGGRFRTPHTPEGEAAGALDALRIGADPETVRFLDRALRALSARLAADGRGLPTVYAAWLTADSLHLQMAWAEGEPPAPWQLGQDRTFWRLDRAALPADADVAAAAPFPGLAALGTLDGARLLLNLEAVPGIVSLKGGRSDRTALLAAIAAELATNGWSDRMTVTLVGFAEDLTSLAPTRVRHLADVAEVIEIMSAETAMRVGALRTAGQDSVLTGRTGPAQHTQWAPHLVLLAAEPTQEQALQLAELAVDSGRLGIGYVVATQADDLPGAAWDLEITAGGRLLAPLLGLDLEAQLLPPRQYAAVLELFAAADPDGDPSPSPTSPPFMVDLSDQGRPGVYARLVGPFELIGIDAPGSDRSPLLHEALALLLLHREGVHPRVLASALWPRGVTEDVRDALIGRLREWLGTDLDGPRLTVDGAGRLRLSTSVVSDWDVLQTLHHEATQGRGAEDPKVRHRLLSDALALSRGPLLADRPADRYGWLAHEIVEAQLPVLVAEVGLALAALRTEAGRPEAAVEAVEAALAISPADERLWLELLRATHATGDPQALSAAADSLLARNSALHGPARRLPPRVEALLEELHPAAGGRVAN